MRSMSLALYARTILPGASSNRRAFGNPRDAHPEIAQRVRRVQSGAAVGANVRRDLEAPRPVVRDAGHAGAGALHDHDQGSQGGALGPAGRRATRVRFGCRTKSPRMKWFILLCIPALA